MGRPVEDEESVVLQTCNQLGAVLQVYTLDAEKYGLPTSSSITWETVRNYTILGPS